MLGVLAAGLVGVAFAAGSAYASSPVNVPCTGATGGATGLVNAISADNSGGGGTINLAAGCTYSLTTANPVGSGNGLPVVTTAITINGRGTTIAGNNTDFRILAVESPGNLTLHGLTITGGNSSSLGGGIADLEGTLTLNASVVRGNTAAQGGGGIGGGTMNTGPLGTIVLNGSLVLDNTTPGGGGGGILNHAGTLTLNNSLVRDNTAFGGGGIASGTGNGNTGGNSFLTLNWSIVEGNTANGGPMSGGGGVVNGGTFVANNSAVSNNSALGGVGAGILNHANATITRTFVSGNSAPSDSVGDLGLGGGIANFGFYTGIGPVPPPSVLVVNQSLVVGNSASGGGGGILNQAIPPVALGTVTLDHTLVFLNHPDNCSPTGSITGCFG